MDKREAAIISAYTGIMIGRVSATHAYIEEKLGFPVLTHQIPQLREQIQNATREDFVKLNNSIIE